MPPQSGSVGGVSGVGGVAGVGGGVFPPQLSPQHIAMLSSIYPPHIQFQLVRSNTHTSPQGIAQFFFNGLLNLPNPLFIHLYLWQYIIFSSTCFCFVLSCLFRPVSSSFNSSSSSHSNSNNSSYCKTRESLHQMYGSRRTLSRCVYADKVIHCLSFFFFFFIYMCSKI